MTNRRLQTQGNRHVGAKIAAAVANACVKLPALATVAVAFSVASAADGPWQSPASIRAAALSFATARAGDANGRIEIEPRPVDPRLRLRQCDRSLEAYAPAGGALRGNAVVGVRCPGSTPWKVFVPMQVRVMAPVAVAQGALAAGHRLSAADVRWTEQDVARGAAGFVAGRGTPVGRVLRHSVRDGQRLRPNMVRAANIVRRGQQVTLAVNHPTLAIRMGGVALADGALGDRVRARNGSSGRVVEGTIRAEGLIEISIF